MKSFDEITSETTALLAANAKRRGEEAKEPEFSSLDDLLKAHDDAVAESQRLDQVEAAQNARRAAEAATPAVAPLPATASLTEQCAHARATGAVSSGGSGFGGTERASGRTAEKSLTRECAAAHPGPRYRSGEGAWPEPKREPTITERCQLYLAK